MDIDSTKDQFENMKADGVDKIKKIKEQSGRFRSLLPSDIEVSFFSVVRKFCMFIATISILVVAVLLMTSLSDFMSSADEDISEPDVSYSDYKDKLQKRYDQSYIQKDSGMSSTEQKENKIAEDSKKLKFEKEFDEYYIKIESNLNEYAKTVSDDPVSNYNLREWILKKAIDENSFEIMEELDDFVDDLINDANNLKKLGQDDVRRQKWIKSLEWFFDERDAQLQLENARIQQEHLDAMVDKTEALSQLMVAGSAFMVFMFFVIILVLIRIETNTRIQVKS